MTTPKTDPLVFGTDGWRGLIARDFTFDNLRRATDALARALPAKSRVAVGYDHRFLSEEFARAVSSVLGAQGHTVILFNHPTTSPALSFSLQGLKARAGVMLTASHNPSGYNGFKIKLPPGRSADAAFTARVESLLDPEIPRAGTVPPAAEHDPTPAYAAHVVSHLDKKMWSGARRLSVVFDAMHGSGAAVWPTVSKKLGLAVHPLRMERDPLFGGTPPEPIEKNLSPLMEAVRREKADVGLAVDGDGDRLGVVDDQGVYWPPHAVFPLILQHLVENRKLKGAVVQAISLGYVSERMAKEFKLPFVEVPVGFKHVADQMAKTKVLWGGEESGGYGVGLWAPERDGILSGLLVLEAVLAYKKPLSVLRAEMAKRFGPSAFSRVDLSIKAPVTDKAAWSQSILKKMPAKVAGQTVKETRDKDGLKILFTDESWVLLRPSGTEPLLRLYAEAPTQEAATLLVTKAQEWAGGKSL